jgi:hypothetical protein
VVPQSAEAHEIALGGILQPHPAGQAVYGTLGFGCGQSSEETVMDKFRIVPSDHSTDYFQLERRKMFGWEYVKGPRDKEELRQHAEHMRQEPEYLT